MRVTTTAVVICALAIVSVSSRRVASIDERWVCNIKRSCMECLQFRHCSWCPTENRCFSSLLPSHEDFCKNSKVIHKHNGLSLEESAECACTPPEELKQNCRPPGQLEDCYGRGTCLCGRCSCNSTFDQIHPTKMVFGEYCQYDNFSCDGPRCNEGPYSIVEAEEDDDDTGVVDDTPTDAVEDVHLTT
ncbi:uncharacterized protein LOC128683468 [Plodia interpunctella]|uniref:uncharacterized protein LOC128683468 n=1 Tax=Plodia interpunctella TaxID=58824 RepID=UPI002367469A|nr:uncharacterized protein LOC128683468 [Plodia interpunctella]